MKKAVVIVFAVIIYILYTTMLQPSTLGSEIQKTAEVKPKSESPASGYKTLKTITRKDGSNVYILVKDNSIYVTTATPQSINVNDMKQLKVNSASSSKLLVNKDNSLPKNFSPVNLTKIDSGKVKLEYKDLKLIPVTLKALYTMVDAAKKAGVKGFIINSAYRSIATQQQIFDANLESFKKTSKTYKEAYDKTRLLVALPGNSEHHTGLSADIFSVNGRHRTSFVGTKEQVWLNKNLTNYGFIIRYPKDKTKETNSTYEPWHIRYVGIPLSTYMKENNLCLEEFYGKILTGQLLKNAHYFFVDIKSNKKVFVDTKLFSKASLETVNSGNMLMSVNY